MPLSGRASWTAAVSDCRPTVTSTGMISSRRWLSPTWTSFRYVTSLPSATVAHLRVDRQVEVAARAGCRAVTTWKYGAGPPTFGGIPGSCWFSARATDPLHGGGLRAQRVVDLTAQLVAHDPVTDERREQDRDRDRRGGYVGESGDAVTNPAAPISLAARTRRR